MYTVSGVEYSEIYKSIKLRLSINKELDFSIIEKEIKNNKIIIRVFANNEYVKPYSTKLIQKSDHINAKIYLFKTRYFNNQYKDINISLLDNLTFYAKC